MNIISINNELAYEYPKNNNYFVTKTGDVYSIFVKGHRGETDINYPHKLSYGQDKDGYYRVVLCNNGKKKYIKVHTMIVETFIGEVIPPNVVNHKDGNKNNNNLENLEIVTPAYNTRHAHLNGLCSQEQKVIVTYNNEKYIFQSIKECLNRFTDLTQHYLLQIKNNEILYSMILFEKRNPEKRVSKIDAYYNGTYYKTFDTFKEADLYFGMCVGTTSNTIKYSEYRRRVNKYKVEFPNVSTIENTQ